VRAAKLLTELVGTAIFFSVIALSAPIGPLAPLAIGGALMVMVYMGGHISGAHYNPAVSLGAVLRGKMPAGDLLPYWAAQLVGGVIAFSFGHLVSSQTPGIHPGPHAGVGAALAVEIFFTTALVLVVLNAAMTPATQGNSFYGLAIGFTIVVAAFAGGPISGGAFNPAVGFGATFGSAIYAAGSWSDLWIYIVGPFIGAGIGAAIHAGQMRGVAEPDPRTPT